MPVTLCRIQTNSQDDCHGLKSDFPDQVDASVRYA